MSDKSQRRANHREGEIVEVLSRAGGAARIAVIANALDVSEETVRRNIRRLADDARAEPVRVTCRLPSPGGTRAEMTCEWTLSGR